MTHKIKNRLVLIIPSHNRKESLISVINQCIDQLKSINIKYSVVVVVDGCTDGTQDRINNLFPSVIVVEGNGYWFYTKSINEGSKFAIDNLNPDYVLALNDDVDLHKDYFSCILRIIEKCGNNTIIGSLGITKEDPPRIVTSGNKWKNKFLGRYESHFKFLEPVNPEHLTGLHDSVTLPGRGMLIPTNILMELDFFDESFKQYHSDGDFTLRALKAGYPVKISWDAKIYVKLKETSATTSFLNNSFRQLIKSYFNPVSRNYIPSKSRFIWRHNPKVSYLIIMSIFIMQTFWKVIKLKIKFRGLNL